MTMTIREELAYVRRQPEAYRLGWQAHREGLPRHRGRELYASKWRLPELILWCEGWDERHRVVAGGAPR